MPSALHLLRIALLGLGVVLLSGCIEGREEIWLKVDGSGRLKASYRMPHVIMGQFGGAEQLTTTLREAAERDPHVDLSEISYRSEKRDIILEFEGTYDDLRKLCTFPQRQLRHPDDPDKPVKAEILFGVTDLTISAKEISLHRTIDISSIIPKRLQKNPKLLRDSQFHYVLNLPVSATETNAHVLPADRRRLEWVFLLRDHVTEPMVLTARGPLPIPWWVWLLAGLVLVLPAIVLIRFARRKRALTRS